MSLAHGRPYGLWTFPILVLMMALSSCGEEILVANFNGNTLGQPPAHNQQVGTVDVLPPTSNTVVATISGLPSNWVQITRPSEQSDIAGMIGNATAAKGEGDYSFTATMHLPEGAGVATLQFEPFGQVPAGLAYFHLDFMENNTVRVNDNAQEVFGSFPRNAPFTVQVDLHVAAKGSSADVSLGGAGATGTHHVSTFTGSSFAPQFGSVRLFMGFPHMGTFHATNLVLRYKG